MAKNKKSNKISIFEIIWYSLCGGIGLWGLTFIVLGVIARNLKSDADLVLGDAAYKAAMKLGFFNSGLILLVAATLAAVIVLLITAKKADREVEKQQRRAARLAAANAAEEAADIPVEEQE